MTVWRNDQQPINNPSGRSDHYATQGRSNMGNLPIWICNITNTYFVREYADLYLCRQKKMFLSRLTQILNDTLTDPYIYQMGCWPTYTHQMLQWPIHLRGASHISWINMNDQSLRRRSQVKYLEYTFWQCWPSLAKGSPCLKHCLKVYFTWERRLRLYMGIAIVGDSTVNWTVNSQRSMPCCQCSGSACWCMCMCHCVMSGSAWVAVLTCSARTINWLSWQVPERTMELNCN